MLSVCDNFVDIVLTYMRHYNKGIIKKAFLSKKRGKQENGNVNELEGFWEEKTEEK